MQGQKISASNALGRMLYFPVANLCRVSTASDQNSNQSKTPKKKKRKESNQLKGCCELPAEEVCRVPEGANNAELCAIGNALVGKSGTSFFFFLLSTETNTFFYPLQVNS